MAKKNSTKVLREFAAKKAKAAEAKKETTKKEPKKDAVARDAFGCKEGSQAATINAALGTKPQKPAALAEATGLDGGRIRAHLKHLLGKGLVVESDAGFAIKARGAK